MERDKEIIIKIETVVYGGFGLGRADGKVIFTDSALPGDIVRISIREEHRDYSVADIVEIVESSPLRVTPECPVFGSCGGCSYLNTSYDTELEFKKTIIKDQLRRVTGISDSHMPEIETIADRRYGYRSHTRFNTENGLKGFFRKQSNRIIPFPVKGCLLLSDGLNSEIDHLNIGNERAEVRAAADSVGNIHICMNNETIQITETENGLSFHREISGFFQANRFLRKTMIQKVLELSTPDKKSSFLDICCGCGFFTLPLAEFSAHGYGFDIDKKSIAYARKNSKLNGIKNVTFHNLSESEIKGHLYDPGTVIIDPPRSGLSKKGRRTVNAINAGKIVYVSCNPSTFARDLKDFMKNGYSLQKLIFIDMFPCTHHIELISLITRSDMTV